MPFGSGSLPVPDGIIEPTRGKFTQKDAIASLCEPKRHPIFARDLPQLKIIDQALEWLERACAERNVFPLLSHADPLYDHLRSDSRFGTLLRQFGLISQS